MNARPVVYSIVVSEVPLNIYPDSKFYLASFDNVKFNFVGEKEDFKDKIVFESCHFENCEGLPYWITAISQRSIIHTDTTIVLDTDMNTMDTVYKNKNVVIMPLEATQGKHVESRNQDQTGRAFQQVA